MTSSSRRVFAFVAAGLLCAAAIGFVVWRTSSPERVTVGPSAASAGTSSLTTTASSTHHTYTTTASTPPPETSPEQVAAPATDPYLPPNAVFNRTAPAVPTAVYRPDNISSLRNQQAPVTTAPQYPQGQHTPQGQPGVSPSQQSSASATPSAPAPVSTAPNGPSAEPSEQSAPQTASPQGSKPNDRNPSRVNRPEISLAPGPQPAPRPQPAPEASEPAGDSADKAVAGMAQEVPKPADEHLAGAALKEPTDAKAHADEMSIGTVPADVLDQLADAENLANADEGSRTNEAPTPVADVNDAPAGEEPTTEEPGAEGGTENSAPAAPRLPESPELTASPAEVSGSTAADTADAS